MTGLLDDLLDSMFGSDRHRRKYLRRYWWRFVDVQRQPLTSAVPARVRVWPPFWGVRLPLGGDQR